MRKQHLVGLMVFIAFFLFVGLGISSWTPPQEINQESDEEKKEEAEQNNSGEEIAREKAEKNNKNVEQIEVEEKIEKDKKEEILDSNHLNQNTTRNMKRIKVKGIYLTGHTAGSPKRVANLIELVENTELNAMVIDLKDASGKLTYRSKVPLAVEIGALTNKILDPAGLVAELKKRGIYTIARIVVFKDPILALKHPELAILDKRGGLWKDYKGNAWLNPYDYANWSYILKIAEEAVEFGFEEIQFDYVRFPTDGPTDRALYRYAKETTMSDAITGFLRFAREKLRSKGVWVSADVFGLTCSAEDDMGIGQKLEKIAGAVDYICPMVYPSHYATGTYGYKNPNAEPYGTVLKSLQDALKKLETLSSSEEKAIIRPWLQDFTYKTPAYGTREVKKQIQAVYDSGLEEWLLWNAGNTYSVEALKKED